MVAFGFLYPLVVNPYLGLMPEITPFLKERINLSALMGYAEIVGRVVAAGLTGFAITYFIKHEGKVLNVPIDGYKFMAVDRGDYHHCDLYGSGGPDQRDPARRKKGSAFRADPVGR